MTSTAADAVTIVYALAALSFIGIAWGFAGILNMMKTSALAATTMDSSNIEKCSRTIAAILILKLMSVLLWAALSLAFGLGFWKAFANVAVLLVPDGTLGISILISYSGLIAAILFVKDYFLDAAKKVFS